MADTNGQDANGPCHILSSRVLDILALMIMYGSDYKRGNTADHNDKMMAIFIYLEGVADIGGMDSFSNCDDEGR